MVELLIDRFFVMNISKHYIIILTEYNDVSSRNSMENKKDDGYHTIPVRGSSTEKDGRS